MLRRSTHLLSSFALGGLFLITPVLNPSVYAGEPAPARTTDTPAAAKGTATAKAAPELPVPTEEERRFVELVNEERRKRGLNELVIDPLLIQVAREHSREMRDRAYFNHNSPTPEVRTPMDRYLKAVAVRPEYACVGENLFYCSIADVQRGHAAFMNSPTHRDNVLFPRYEKIGVGIVKNERGEFWVTQMYLTNTDPQIYARKMAKSK
jgi:uncharacterized protein YkwD